MASQPGGHPVSYHPHVNRAVTRKWKEAQQVDYDGDGWGDDGDDDNAEQPAPASARTATARQPTWGAPPPSAFQNGRGQPYPSNRSVTNPSPNVGPSRQSFDRGDDRRYLPSNVSGFQEGPYPAAQRAPLTEPRHDFASYEGQMQGRYGPPQLRVQTQNQDPYSQGPYTAGVRGSQHSEGREGPFSATPIPDGRRSQSSGRPSYGDPYIRRESPMRPGSKGPQGVSPSRQPPRKSSVGQISSSEVTPALGDSAPAVPAPSASIATDGKPLPIIFPADIYKLFSEESEKQRRSEESSRLNSESATTGGGQSRNSESAPPLPAMHPKPGESQGTDQSARPQPILGPVAERESAYNVGNPMRSTPPSHASSVHAQDVKERKSSEPISASSEYSNGRDPDPVSASSVYSSHFTPNVSRNGQDLTSGRSHPLSSVQRMSGDDKDPVRRDGYQDEQDDLQIAPPVPEKDNQNTSQAQQTSAASGLHHNTSLGYRSVVEQAFDESQNQVPLTPISTADSLARSASANTVDISPIMKRDGERWMTQAGNAFPTGHPTILEDQHEGRSTPASSTALKAAQEERPLPPPPSIQPGFRRDSTPPSRENSPARRPLNVIIPDVPQPELATLSAVSLASTSAPVTHPSQRDGPDVPGASIDQRPVGEKIDDHSIETTPVAEKSDPGPRSASDEYQEWQAQQKQFRERMGIEDNNTSTSDVSSPISRAESPPKGTVRGLAEKLESRSGRSSPAGAVERNVEQPRPAVHSRLESFRPSIPGGWQSDTSVPRGRTPQQDAASRSTTPQIALTGPPEHQKVDATPIAGQPEAARGEGVDVSEKAFAAAAAAGTVLAGVLTGYVSSLTGDKAGESREQSEDESWNSNAVSLAEEATLKSQGLPPSDTTRETAPDMAATQPLSKDTPSGPSLRTNVEYFPAPLRLSRSNEMNTTPRPPVPTELSPDAPGYRDDQDKLHKDIVKSLTPRSSQSELASSGQLRDQAHAETPEDAELSEPSDVEDSALPEEYDSYWDEEEDTTNVADSVTVTDTTAARESAAATDTTTNRGPAAVDSTAAAVPQTEPYTISNFAPGSLVKESADEPTRAFLAQPFPWETGPNQSSHGEAPTPKVTRDAPIDADSPDTVKAGGRMSSSNISQTAGPDFSTVTGDPQTPTRVPADGSGSRALPGPAIGLYKATVTTPSDSPVPPPKTSMSDVSTVFPTQAVNLRDVPFRNIMKLETSEKRVQAYTTSRQLYGSADVGLERWLRFVGTQSPDQSDLLSSNGLFSSQQAEVLHAHRPSPSRTRLPRISSEHHPTTEMGSPSSTKQRQEDGKRLLLAAGKYGGKAGLAAKGLFAKGKDKLRTASASDKGLRASRRKSAGPDELQPEHEHSTLPSTPPQIPPQDLSISPVGDDSWSILHDTTEDDPKVPASDETSHQDPSIASNEDGRSSVEASGYPAPFADQESGPRAVSPHNAQVSASSPRVSALGSTYNGDRDIPSRSISEVTRSGGDRSPIGRTVRAAAETFPPPTHTLAARHGRDTLVVAVTGPHASDDISKDQTDLTPAGNLSSSRVQEEGIRAPATTDTGMKRGNEDFSKVVDNETPDRVQQPQTISLPLPHDRPAIMDSIISTVGPVVGGSGNGVTQDVSAGPVRGTAAKGMIPPSVGAVVSTEQEQAESSRRASDGLPVSQTANANPRPAGSGPGSTPQIVQVADLSVKRHTEEDNNQSRPFSFVGTNTIFEALQRDAAEQDMLNRSVQPSIPLSGSLSKEISNVSVDEVRGNSDPSVNRLSKSYSRPFGAEPNMEDHPAFRSTPDAMDRSRMYSTDNPLPSARRPLEDLNKYREKAAAAPAEPDEPYRIPGPYGQEYRSPKQQPQGFITRPMQDPAGQQQQYRPVIPQGPGPAPSASNQPFQPQAGYGPAASPGMPRPILEAEKPKHRSLGALLSGRPKPRPQMPPPQHYPDTTEDRTDNEKRNSLFRPKSRQDSIGSSQNQSLHDAEARDQLTGLRSSEVGDGAGRRRSKDLFRSPTSSTSTPVVGKKKGFSGLGSLFGRSGTSKRGVMQPPQQSVQRSSTMQNAPAGPYNQTQSQQAPQQSVQRSSTMQPAPAGPYNLTQSQQQPPYQNPGGFRGMPPPAGGYYDPTGQREKQPQSAFPHGPDSISNSQFPGRQQNLQQQPNLDSQQYYGDDRIYQPHPQQVVGQEQPQRTTQQIDQRPSALRLETGGSASPDGSNPPLGFRNQYSGPAPASAPPIAGPRQFYDQSQQQQLQNQSLPQNRTNRDVYGYGYSTSAGPHSNAATVGLPDPRGHAVDLHKRSRSPRNGRRTSSEDLTAQAPANNPVTRLGTFSSSSRSPNGGIGRGEGEEEQEKPWRIVLPNESDSEKNKRRPKQAQIERSPGGTTSPISPQQQQHQLQQPQQHQTVAEQLLGVPPSRAPLQATAGAGNRAKAGAAGGAAVPAATHASFVAELPGSNAEGYESDEEITMSATAYPGQEWMPLAEYARWDE